MIRLALRSLARRPGFVVAVVGLLAVGIGANTAIFSVVDAVLFRPLTAPRPDELVRGFATDEKHSGPQGNFAYPVYRDYRDGARAFSALAAFADWNAVHVVREGAEAERVGAGLAAPELFEVLGARPALGRLFGAADDTPGAPPVAVLTWPAFERRFGGDRSVVGTTVRMNAHPVEIVGVLERGFRGPSLDAFPELWMPIAAAAVAAPDLPGEESRFESRRFSWLDIIGRLAPGTTMAQAQAELDVLTERSLAAQREAGEPLDPHALLFSAERAAIDPSDERTRRVAWLLAGLVSLVLLASATNVSALLLARAVERRGELAVRAALGASSGRLARELLVEGTLLAVAATLLALPVASWTVELLLRPMRGLPLPVNAAASILDPRVLAFTAAAGVAVTLLAAVLPAWRATRRELNPALRGSEAALGDLRLRFGLRQGLVAAQAALAMVLLVGAGLFLRTLAAVGHVDVGFETEGAAVGWVDFSRQGYSSERAATASSQLAELLRATPGVAAAGLGCQVPVYPGGMRLTLRAEGYEYAPDEDKNAHYNPVSPGYFGALGLRLLAGRDFEAGDREGAALVAVVNRTFAERYFGGVDAAIGHRLLPWDPKKDWRPAIVGVVEAVRERSVRETAPPLVYVPLAQDFSPVVAVLARTRPGDEAAAIAALRAATRKVDAELPVHRLRTLDEHVGLAFAAERATAKLLVAGAILALVLVGAGLAALVAFTTRLRTREFAIRVVLGAERPDLVARALRESVVLAGVGTLAGAAIAAPLVPLVESLLFGVGRLDLLSWAGAAVALAAVAALASLPCAWRAAGVDPSASLRDA